jgi:hypothetical protein
MKQGFFMGNGPSFLATIKPIKSIVWDHLGGTKTINLSHVFLLLCNDMVEETLLRPPKKSILDYGFLVMVYLSHGKFEQVLNLACIPHIR